MYKIERGKSTYKQNLTKRVEVINRLLENMKNLGNPNGEIKETKPK
jgi:hypothetical protein